jgi:hypothetical protein
MDHPDVIADLDGVEHPKRVAPISQGDFEQSAIKPMERLGLIRLAALGRNRERAPGLRLDRGGELFEVAPRGLQPGKWGAYFSLRSADKFVNKLQALALLAGVNAGRR